MGRNIIVLSLLEASRALVWYYLQAKVGLKAMWAPESPTQLRRAHLKLDTVFGVGIDVFGF